MDTFKWHHPCLFIACVLMKVKSLSPDSPFLTRKASPNVSAEMVECNYHLTHFPVRHIPHFILAAFPYSGVKRKKIWGGGGRSLGMVIRKRERTRREAAHCGFFALIPLKMLLKKPQVVKHVTCSNTHNTHLALDIIHSMPWSKT